MSQSLLQSNPAFMEACTHAVERMIRGTAGIRAAVAATGDGIALTGRAVESFDQSKLAAVASSISAIGNVVSDETHVGACRSVLVDAEHGYTLVVAAAVGAATLVLCVVADKNAIPGQILFTAKDAMATMQKALT